MNYLLAIIAIIISYSLYLYRKISVPPSFAKSIPVVSFIKIMIAALTNKTVDYRFKKILWPKLRQKGYAIIYGPFGWNVIVAKPAIARDMFRKADQFLKPIISNPGSVFELFAGVVNIVASNHSDWKRIRRSANPIFSQAFKVDVFSSNVLETLKALDERVNKSQGNPIQVQDLMSLMALDILMKGIFSIDIEALSSKGNAQYYKIYRNIIGYFFNPIFSIIRPLSKLSFGPPEQARKKVKEFNKFIMGIIAQRRQDLKDGKFLDSKDILSTMLREDPDSPYEPLTDEELVHNFNIFFLAGHDTTANTLSYVQYYLARNRDIQDKLRNEIYQKMDLDINHGKLVVPTSEQLKNMEYLNLVIKETMRISPAVLQIGRKLAQDYVIPEDNVVLPESTSVGLSIYSILNDPAIYPNPEKFDPERFLNGKYDTDIYMPFGGGNRICVGLNFSLMEQKVFISLLLQKFELKIAKDNPDYEKLRVSGLGLTRPQDLKLNFEARL